MVRFYQLILLFILRYVMSSMINMLDLTISKLDFVLNRFFTSDWQHTIVNFILKSTAFVSRILDFTRFIYL